LYYKKTTHGGFPIISKAGILQGLILRSQLITLLKEKVFQDNPDPNFCPPLDLSVFTKEYPRYPSIYTVKISPVEKNKYINLSPFMNLTPYLIQKTATVERVFRLYRTMGLRHLPVIDEHGKVVGMITRRDLVNFESKTKNIKKTSSKGSWNSINNNIQDINFDAPEDGPVHDPDSVYIPAFSSFPSFGSRKELNRYTTENPLMNNLPPEILQDLEPAET